MKHIYKTLLTTTILSFQTIFGAGGNNVVDVSPATETCPATQPTLAEVTRLLANPSEEAYIQARRLLESVVDSKDPAVLQELGMMLYLGLGGTEDVQQGINLLEEAADLGAKAAQYKLAGMYRIGQKMPINSKRSGYWSGRLARNTAPVVNSSLLEDNFDEFSVQFGKEIGIRVRAGDPDAELKVGLIMLSVNAANPKDSDYQWLEKAANKGNIEAQYLLGYYELMNYRHGYDHAKNLYWLEKAADRGHEKAMEKLLQTYSFGPLVPKDLVKAKALAEKLYQMGNDHGHGRLIDFNLSEFEISKKTPDAATIALIQEYINKSKSSDASAEIMFFSALMLLGKQGTLAHVPDEIIQPNFEEAVRLFVRAAEAKYVLPHYILGTAEIFEEGKYGQAKDLAKALHYYKKAALLGDKKSD